MFEHLCAACGNIEHKITADFSHVCTVCHSTVSKILERATGRVVAPDKINPRELRVAVRRVRERRVNNDVINYGCTGQTDRRFAQQRVLTDRRASP